MTNTTRCQVIKKKKRQDAKGPTWVGFDTYEAGACSVKLLALVACVTGHVASRTNDLQDGLSWVVFKASLRDIWISLMIWSAQRSGGRPLGRRHDDCGVEPRMSMAWVPVCRWHMCPKAPRRSLRIVVVKLDKITF